MKNLNIVGIKIGRRRFLRRLQSSNTWNGFLTHSMLRVFTGCAPTAMNFVFATEMGDFRTQLLEHRASVGTIGAAAAPSSVAVSVPKRTRNLFVVGNRLELSVG